MQTAPQAKTILVGSAVFLGILIPPAFLQFVAGIHVSPGIWPVCLFAGWTFSKTYSQDRSLFTEALPDADRDLTDFAEAFAYSHDLQAMKVLRGLPYPNQRKWLYISNAIYLADEAFVNLSPETLKFLVAREMIGSDRFNSRADADLKWPSVFLIFLLVGSFLCTALKGLDSVNIVSSVIICFSLAVGFWLVATVSIRKSNLAKDRRTAIALGDPELAERAIRELSQHSSAFSTMGPSPSLAARLSAIAPRKELDV